VGKNKLIHFEEDKSFPHFFQPEFSEIKDGYKFKGVWSKDFFLNFHPIVLELGCGKGEYTVGLAKKYPGRNYIGIDNKGARMWRGAKTTQLENIKNAAFLRIKIEQIAYCFDEDEVDEIWITFPDPLLKTRKIRKRLTAPKFLGIYRTILKSGGIVHLKTDNTEFYHYTLEMIQEFNCQVLNHTSDLYHSGLTGDAHRIQTFYEQKYLEAESKIKYIQFKFNDGQNKK